jgi:hypoxanthine phosphoribosyltransferase
MREDLERVEFTTEMIAERVREIGAQITKDYEGREPLILGVLKGSFMFVADLVRSIDLKCEVQFISASSYGLNSVTSGEVAISAGLGVPVKGRDVIIIEDILDTGVTLTKVIDYIGSLDPSSQRLCVFLDKTVRRQVPLFSDYTGFVCPDGFYVGYGLDYAERYRNLPFIGILKPEIYS